MTELLADGVLSCNRDVNEARTRLAQKLMRFASSGRSVIQIWQLLSRALRNEQSSARHHGIENVAGADATGSRGGELLPNKAHGQAQS